MSKQQNVLDGTSKAWCCWNGTGTAAIRDSFNLSSITDHGTGEFSQNFTSNYNNTNYVISGAHAAASPVATYVYHVQPTQESGITASSARVYNVYSGRSYFGNASSGIQDYPYCAFHSHGDLA